MTEKQQQIIDTLIEEFNRIESASKPSRTFNLIDIAKLNARSQEIALYKAEEEADRVAWKKLAMDEALRLITLFQADLPNNVVELRNINYPDLLIKRNERASCHYESCVHIDVIVVRHTTVKDSQGHLYTRGIELNYTCSSFFTKTYFKTIEELVSQSSFKEAIRNRVL